MEQILKGEGIEARGLTWEQLGIKVRLNVDRKIVKEIIGTIKYYKYTAC
jgi:hypothetical protein